MLISAVLRILDSHGVSPEAALPAAHESFSALMASRGILQGGSPAASESRQDGSEVPAKIQSPQQKDRASLFSVERHSYDSFLRALEESKKPLGIHALDLFQ